MNKRIARPARVIFAAGVAIGALTLVGCSGTTTEATPASTSHAASLAPATTAVADPVAPAPTTELAPVVPSPTNDFARAAPKFVNAVHQCDGLPEISIINEGEAIHMTVGGTTEFDVAEADAVCVLTKLKMPASMLDKLIHTVHTDYNGDLQTARWGGLEANWLYGPDYGLDILLIPDQTQ